MSNYLTNEEELLRQRRSLIFYTVSTGVAISVGLYLLWALRGLIVPTAIGMLMAYICLPLIGYLKSRGFSRFWAITCLFGIFCLVLFSTTKLAGDLIPDRKTELELQARIRYKLDEKFKNIMGLNDKTPSGNWFYALFGRELEPLRAEIDQALRMSETSHNLFADYQGQPGATGNDLVMNRYWLYHLANRRRDLEGHPETTPPGQGEEPLGISRHSPISETKDASLLLTVFNAVSLWLLTPMVFLILLVDDGKLKRELVRKVPNRYFEMTLTILANINEALGRYLRGTFIECFLVGSSFTVCLFLIGLEIQWASAIGIIAGISNAIPFLGPAIGLLVGVLYAVMAETVSPVLPLINADNFLAAVLVVVAIVQLADNAIFQPYILGGAVDLHPLTVVFGVMGGAVIFGFAGMLFAVPAIMISKVIIATMYRQFRAYDII